MVTILLLLLFFSLVGALYPLSSTNSQGVEEMKRNKVVLCGCVKNVAHNMHHIEQTINELGNSFADYTCLLVENDSTDNSRALLLELAKRNPKVIVLGCGENEKKCTLNVEKKVHKGATRSRIHKMATVRNVYLNYIRERWEHFKDYKYMCVWDADINGVLYKNGLQNTFKHFANNDKISAVCANGYYKVGPIPFYYDTFAHVPSGYQGDTTTTSHRVRTYVDNAYFGKGKLVDMDSCFSGFTVYRLQDAVGSRYDYPHNENEVVKCEHTYFNKGLKGKVMMNPNMRFHLKRNG